MSEQTPSTTRLVDAFTELYRSATNRSADIALCLMLKMHSEAIEPLFEQRDPHWLHKAFRQTDVTGSGSVDSVIWHLIHASEDFWPVLHFFWNGTLERADQKRAKVLLAIAEQQRDKLLAALEFVVAEWEKGDDVFGGIQQGRAAIAEVKGQS